jgi:hypothetical protein
MPSRIRMTLSLNSETGPEESPEASTFQLGDLSMFAPSLHLTHEPPRYYLLLVKALST